MNESNHTQPKTSISDFLDALFQKELADQTRYDPKIVQLVQEHLGQSRFHVRAGFRLAKDLTQLAQTRAVEVSSQ